MLLLIVYNQRFLLYCVLKKLNCDDFVLFLLLLLLWLLLVAFFEKSNGEKKNSLRPSFPSGIHTLRCTQPIRFKKFFHVYY